MNEKSLYDRLINSKKKRPSLADKSADEILDHIHLQLTERESYYLQSKLVVKGESMEIKSRVDLISIHMKKNGLR